MNKSIYETMLMMYMAMGMNSTMPFGMPTKRDWDSLTDDEKIAYENYIKSRYKQLQLKKGLKEFTIDGVTVLALNEKNAKRKVKKYLEMSK